MAFIILLIIVITAAAISYEQRRNRPLTGPELDRLGHQKAEAMWRRYGPKTPITRALITNYDRALADEAAAEKQHKASRHDRA